MKNSLNEKNILKKEIHPSKLQTIGEEIANSITHGIGAGLSIAALVILVVLASKRGDVWRIVSFSIYGATLILLYLSSTLYHSFVNPKIKNIFRVLDHSTIYLLIAGSYTPITLTFMSVSGMTFRVGQTLGPLLMGMVISIWGIGGAFYAGAGLSIVMFIIVFRL
ncbi:unnamed protein product [marine sediment metagenome]|uniref:Hemolysin III family channel protein n=1 Tax=marine sediment metagenome TaxID=412755 RepID=X0ZT23_9ZZZZ